MRKMHTLNGVSKSARPVLLTIVTVALAFVLTGGVSGSWPNSSVQSNNSDNYRSELGNILGLEIAQSEPTGEEVNSGEASGSNQSETPQFDQADLRNEIVAVGVKETSDESGGFFFANCRPADLTTEFARELLPAEQELIANGQAGQVTTLELKIPSFGWLNSLDASGEGPSPFITPSAYLARSSDALDINPTQRFALKGRVTTTGASFPIPVLGNGITASLLDINDFRNFSAPTLRDQISEYLTTNPYSTSDLTEYESEMLSRVNPFLSPVSSDDLTRLIAFSSERLAESECTGLERIDYIYTGGEHVTNIVPGDTYISPEFVLGDELASEAIQEIEIPLLDQALAIAFKRQKLANADLFSLDTPENGPRIVHRNRLGLKVSATKSSYIDRGNTYESAGIAEDTTEFSIIRESDDLGDPLRQETYELFYPWAGQLREIYKRISLINDWDSALSTDDPAENFHEDMLNQLNDLQTFSVALVTSPDGGPIISFGDSFESSGGAATPLAEFERAAGLVERNARAELNLQSCTRLDNYAERVNSVRDYLTENSASNGQVGEAIRMARELEQAILNTDCIDESGVRTDPLQDYLCSKNLLGADDCIDSAILAVSLEQLCREYTETGEDRLEQEILKRTQTGEVLSAAASYSNGNSNGIVNSLPKLELISPIASTHVITQNFKENHPGVDVGSLPVGTPLRTAERGRVLFAGDVRTLDPGTINQFSLWRSPNGGYGNAVLIQHDDDLLSLSAHLSQVNVRTGDVLSRGAPIGLSGNTGNSSGPHLHYELRKIVKPPYQGDPNTYHYDPTCLFRPGQPCSFPDFNGEGSAGVSVASPVPIAEGTSIARIRAICQAVLADEPEQAGDSSSPPDPSNAEASTLPDSGAEEGFQEISDPDEHRERILNTRGFDFSSTEITQARMEQVAIAYGRFSDVRSSINYSRSELQAREQERIRRVGLIEQYSRNDIDKAVSMCVWFAETGSGYALDFGNSFGLSCGVYCGSRRPQNFTEELGCFLRRPGLTNNDYCLLSSKEECSFNPNQPGIYAERCYGPLSDGNEGFADKVFRCMGEIFEIPRSEDGIYLYPYPNNPYGFIYYDEDFVRRDGGLT